MKEGIQNRVRATANLEEKRNDVHISIKHSYKLFHWRARAGLVSCSLPAAYKAQTKHCAATGEYIVHGAAGCCYDENEHSF